MADAQTEKPLSLSELLRISISVGCLYNFLAVSGTSNNFTEIPTFYACKTFSVAELQYALQEKEEKSDVTTKPAEAKEAENPVNAATGSGDVVTEKLEETSADPVEGSTEAPPPAAEESTEANPATGNSGEDAAEENSSDSEETPEIKLETAPADFRFPTTNQTRHCFTRYIEYHRCVAAKGEGAPECDKFAKYYRALVLLR
ncbi:hypothetical protein Gotur_017067 [Gossypium turneri]